MWLMPLSGSSSVDRWLFLAASLVGCVDTPIAVSDTDLAQWSLDQDSIANAAILIGKAVWDIVHGLVVRWLLP